MLKISRFLHKQRGDALLINVIICAILVSVLGLAVANINIAANTGIIGANTAQQASWYAQSKANEINVVSYSNISSVAQTKATISGTSYDREVIVGTETTVNSVKQIPVTVNVYKSGETIPRATLSLLPTSAGTAPSAATLHGEQLFTSNGTFIVPSGVTQLYISMCGGGGGGSSGCTFWFYFLVMSPPAPIWYNAQAEYCGGGAAALFESPVIVSPGQQITITVGVGGIGGAAPATGVSPNGGTNGGTSSFGSYLTCSGGYGATNGTMSVTHGSTTVSGSQTISPTPAAGAAGGIGGSPGSAAQSGGCIFGMGVPAYNSALTSSNPGLTNSATLSWGIPGYDGTGWGVGGGSGMGLAKGGAGGPGMVLIRW